jgi:ABC-type glycerol-3-phosphate transport system substrate-binding protein
MRRHTAAAVLLAAGLALAGCGAGQDDTKAAAKPSPSKTVNKSDRYLKVAHGITFNGSPTDEELLEYPQQWCDGLAGGHSVKWLFSSGGGGLYPIGDDWGTKKADADALLVAGVKTYCPENLDAVTSELRASGEY